MAWRIWLSVWSDNGTELDNLFSEFDDVVFLQTFLVLYLNVVKHFPNAIVVNWKAILAVNKTYVWSFIDFNVKPSKILLKACLTKLRLKGNL